MRAIALSIALAMGAGAALALDPYDPLALHAYAVERLRDGDFRTAEILLARAARLAPGDERIARTRRTLEAMRAGASVMPEPVPAAPPATAPAPKEAPPPIPPEPPPLWPPK
jgi:Flp pilus assembly protein TadD